MVLKRIIMAEKNTTRTTGSAKMTKIDTTLRFENGRLFITHIPMEHGRQCGFPKNIDVTEQVAEAIVPYINREKDGKG